MHLVKDDLIGMRDQVEAGQKGQDGDDDQAQLVVPFGALGNLDKGVGGGLTCGLVAVGGRSRREIGLRLLLLGLAPSLAEGVWGRRGHDCERIKGQAEERGPSDD
jgi:hypothetical protein